jgi:O-antigen/teichoic acid export membrane protein
MLAEWSLGRPLRNVAILMAGNAIKLGLGFIASILTYRTLPPADAGRLTVVLGLVGVFSLVAEFGFRDAAVNYVAGAASPAEAQSVARSFLAAKMVFGTLAAVLLALLARWLLDTWYPGTVAPGLLRLAALSLFAGGLLNYVQTLLEARQTFSALSLISMAQAVLRAAAIALFYFTGRLALAPLIALEVVVPLALLAYGARFLPPGFLSLRRPLFEHFGKLWRFSRWIAVAAAASTIFLSLDVLFLAHFRPAAEVGVYGVALALLAKFEVVQNVVLTTAFPEACRYHTKPELRAYVWRTLRLTGLASLGFVCLLPFAGWLIVLLYGGNYAAAALPFSLLLIGLVVGLNAQPAAFVLYPLHRPQWIAAGDVLQLIFCTAVGLWLIPLYGVLGAALTVLATRLFGGSLTLALVTWQLR